MSERAHASALPSQVLMRLRWWLPAAWLLSRVPLGSLDTSSVGRLRYALLMAHRTHGPACQRILQLLLRDNTTAGADTLMELAMMAVSTEAPATAVDLLRIAVERAPNRDTARAAQCLLAVQTAAADGTLLTRVGQMVDGLALPKGQLLTVVPVSSRYLELWQLWLGQTQRYVPGVVVAMAMDEATLAALADVPGVAMLDVRDFFAWGDGGRLNPHTRGVLWYLRVLLLQALVERGHTVLILDLDALPVGDLQPLLDAHAAADVIAQQDYSLPMDVAREFGFVLCCGFMVWRPTVAARALLKRFAVEAGVERDDQLALNHLLAQDGIVDPTRDDAAMRFQSGEVRFVCPDPSLVSRDLASGSVVRHFHQTGKSVADLRAAISRDGDTGQPALTGP